MWLTRIARVEADRAAKGARLLTDVLSGIGASYVSLERATAARDTLDDLTWCRSSNGGVVTLRDQALTDVYLVLFPDSELSHLGCPEAFQTVPHNDGTIRVYVRAVSITPQWAGLGLFHELSHVYDFQSGAEPREPTDEQYMAGEARAFHLEMALVNALTSGRLAAALERIVEEPLDPVWVASSGAGLAARLEQMTTGPGARPPGSESEQHMRNGFYRIALLLASHWQKTDPTSVDNPAEAAPVLGQFLASGARTEYQ